MSATSVLITPSGGLGTVLMFLQPGASAIVFNFYQDYAKHTEQQENIYYWCGPSVLLSCCSCSVGRVPSGACLMCPV